MYYLAGGWFYLAVGFHSTSWMYYLACWVFSCFHNPPNSDIDCGIFYVRTDVNACNCIWGCMHTIRESALKVDSVALGEKSLAASGNRTCIGSVPVRWFSSSFIPTSSYEVKDCVVVEVMWSWPQRTVCSRSMTRSLRECPVCSVILSSANPTGTRTNPRQWWVVHC